MADCLDECINKWVFIAEKRRQYCEDCNRRKGMKNGKLRFCYDIGEAPCRACEIDDMLNDVEDFPSADVAPVRHGRWLKIDDFSEEPIDWVLCNRCKAKIPDYDYHYCPNCGADMRETNHER